MLRHTIFRATLFLVVSHCTLFGQTNRLPDYKDATAYEVYSAILAVEAARPETSRPGWRPASQPSPKSRTFVIRGETLRNFGALVDPPKPSGGICLYPEPESATIVGPAIENHIKVNQTKWRLKEKFKLDIPYKLISAETVISMIKPLTDKEDWKEFYDRYPGSGGFIDLSAVGFNSDKSVAVVSFGRWCGPLCGEGGYYVLQKKAGKWTRLDWKGSQCHWVS